MKSVSGNVDSVLSDETSIGSFTWFTLSIGVCRPI